MTMIRSALTTAAILAACATTASAQAPMPFVVAPASPNIGVETAGQVYGIAKGWILASAQQVPESLYSYRPTASVRTFAQLMGHIAGANLMFCGAAMGGGPADEGDYEHTVTTKAGLIDALNKSFAYCDKAYTMTDAAAAAPITMFGAARTKMFALTLNASHDFEHYGNAVTYLRMMGMVPPSSQPMPMPASK